MQTFSHPQCFSKTIYFFPWRGHMQKNPNKIKQYYKWVTKTQRTYCFSENFISKLSQSQVSVFSLRCKHSSQTPPSNFIVRVRLLLRWIVWVWSVDSEGTSCPIVLSITRVIWWVALSSLLQQWTDIEYVITTKQRAKKLQRISKRFQVVFSTSSGQDNVNVMCWNKNVAFLQVKHWSTWCCSLFDTN